MKNRILLWLMTIAMLFSLSPASVALAAENTLPDTLTESVTDILITGTVTPTGMLTIGSGQTLIVHGLGEISNGMQGAPLFEVESGGKLLLDEVKIKSNAVNENGAVLVKEGGLLDLGYNDLGERKAPMISENTNGGNAKNIVIADGARVRLNAAAE